MFLQSSKSWLNDLWVSRGNSVHGKPPFKMNLCYVKNNKILIRITCLFFFSLFFVCWFVVVVFVAVVCFFPEIKISIPQPFFFAKEVSLIFIMLTDRFDLIVLTTNAKVKMIKKE